MTSKFNKLPQKLSVFLFLFACNERIENVKLNNGNWVEKKNIQTKTEKEKMVMFWLMTMIIETLPLFHDHPRK